MFHQDSRLVFAGSFLKHIIQCKSVPNVFLPILCCGISSFILPHSALKAGIHLLITHLLTSVFPFHTRTMGAVLALLLWAGFSHRFFLPAHNKIRTKLYCSIKTSNLLPGPHIYHLKRGLGTPVWSHCHPMPHCEDWWAEPRTWGQGEQQGGEEVA